MNYKRQVTLQSASIPGVSFTIRQPRYTDRIVVDMKSADSVYQITELQIKAQPLFADREKNKAELMKINSDITFITNSKINPLWVELCLMRVEGLTIDGDEIAAKNLYEGPPELVQEIVNACKSGVTMESEEIKNFESPSTLAKPVDGRISLMTVALAKEADSIGQETAESIFATM